MFENIIRNVTRFTDLNEEEKEKFTDLLTYEKIPKKTVLLREGEVCKFEAYIQKGCLRMYCTDDKGAEVTVLFAIEDWWISDIASFQDQLPSKLNIETLEDSEIFMLNPETKESCFRKSRNVRELSEHWSRET